MLNGNIVRIKCCVVYRRTTVQVQHLWQPIQHEGKPQSSLSVSQREISSHPHGSAATNRRGSAVAASAAVGVPGLRVSVADPGRRRRPFPAVATPAAGSHYQRHQRQRRQPSETGDFSSGHLFSICAAVVFAEARVRNGHAADGDDTAAADLVVGDFGAGCGGRLPP